MSVQKVKISEFIKAENKPQPLQKIDKYLHKSIYHVINNYESSKIKLKSCHLMKSQNIDLI